MKHQYRCVLVLGATSGIGKALAERFINEGSFVIVTGRRKERLDEFVNRHGSSKAAAMQFDMANLEQMPKFIRDVTRRYADIDLVFLNAGIQRTQHFAQPTSISFKTMEEELLVNYTAQVAFTQQILPFLLSRPETPATLLYTTSNLALVPLFRNPNYSASKAAMHAMILCLRAELEGTNIKVQELLPPRVQTELHDRRHQPEANDGRALGMPLEVFTDKAFASITAGTDTIFIDNMGMRMLEETESQRQIMFGSFCEAVKAR